MPSIVFKQPQRLFEQQPDLRVPIPPRSFLLLLESGEPTLRRTEPVVLAAGFVELLAGVAWSERHLIPLLDALQRFVVRVLASWVAY